MTDSNSAEIVVIGSGPAGVAAARALLEQGLAVTMLDAGRTMPAGARLIRQEMAASQPDGWNPDKLAARNRNSLRERDGVPLKTVFGSDFPYHFHPEVRDDGALILGSHARGGLSNAWGASIMPLSERDMQSWPLGTDDLAPHYEAVLRWLPHAQTHDELAADYPLFATDNTALELSSQGRALAADMATARDELAGQGITAGRSRLAISDCHYCRQCLHGCPYDFIYSSNSTLDELLNEPGFTYIGNCEITALTEQADHVQLQTAAGESYQAGRVYLGTGVLHTALLMMPLLRKQQLVIKDSAYGLVPFLRYQRAVDIGAEPLITLPQFYMEVDVPVLSERNVHLQWYGYNDFYREELRKKLGPLDALLPEVVARQFTERMWSIQTFLHSDDSPDLLLQLADSGQASLSVSDNPQTAAVFKAVYKLLGKVSAGLGGRVFPSLGRPGMPGGSFHSGGSLPMHRNPAEGQSDLAGRPHGLQRVHIVDSSVFPNIASSTITLSVMANAHRIASGHQQYG